jgi:N,N'-diacetyllegionaminate synthase
MLAHPVNKTDNAAYSGLKAIFEKSLAVSKNLPAGHVLTFDDLEAKKPAGHGVSARDFKSVLGRKLKHRLNRYDFLTGENLV